MTKPTVTIGIPAYNESANLRGLITQIASQKQNSFILKEIIVALDGGNDSSKVVLRGLHNKKISLINGKVRLGKPYRTNQMLAKATSDYVILLDADVKLASGSVLTNLLAPMQSNSQVSLTSGYSLPAPARTFIQKVAYSGTRIWDRVRSCPGISPMYTCEGAIRAFRKDLYKKIFFPDTSADDVYPYIYASLHGFGYVHCPTAKIYYQLPRSMHDFFRQQFRYLQSANIQKHNFDSLSTLNFYNVTFKHRLLSLLHELHNQPLYAFVYCLTWIGVKTVMYFTSPDLSGRWVVLPSTKFHET